MKKIAVLLLCLPFLSGSSCFSTNKGFLNIEKEQIYRGIPLDYSVSTKTVYLYNFMQYDWEKDKSFTKCKLSDLEFEKGKILPDAKEDLTTYVYRQLVDKGFYVSIINKELFPKNIIDHRFNKDSFISAIDRSIHPSNPKVDLVITGIIYRYEERVGKAISAEKPASVGFSLVAISKNRKQVLFRAGFDKTQKSLTEDLSEIKFAAKGKFGWMRASELAKIAADKIVDTMPFHPPTTTDK